MCYENHTCDECSAWIEKCDGLCLRQKCVCYIGRGVKACEKFTMKKSNNEKRRNGDGNEEK